MCTIEVLADEVPIEAHFILAGVAVHGDWTGDHWDIYGADMIGSFDYDENSYAFEDTWDGEVTTDEGNIEAAV